MRAKIEGTWVIGCEGDSLVLIRDGEVV